MASPTLRIKGCPTDGRRAQNNEVLQQYDRSQKEKDLLKQRSESQLPIAPGQIDPDRFREKLLEQYRHQTPTPGKLGTRAFNFLGIAGAIGSLVGLGLVIWPESLNFIRNILGISGTVSFDPNGPKDFFLIAITFSSIVWAIYRTTSTPTRASEEVYFSHEAIHTVRDFISAENRTISHEKSAVVAVLQSAEKAFTLVTKRKCSATIKIVTNDSRVVVSHTSDTPSYSTIDQTGHDISSYSSIASITRDDSRFYICNDIWMSFRNGSYDHPSLKEYHQRGVWRQLLRLAIEYVWPPRAPIGFRSTLVIPIRFIDNNFTGNVSEQSPYVYLGFLCIDSKSRRAFKSRVITEIGALYADAICAIFLTSKLQGEATDAYSTGK